VIERPVNAALPHGPGKKASREPKQMKPEEQLSYEERKRRFFEKVDSGYYTRPAKPKVPVVTLPVSPKIAEAVRANPESVRVSARGEDGIAVIEGPRGNPTGVIVRIDLVSDVDAQGRPVWPKVGVVHEYNPLGALRRD
jgi:hypothetical protein